MVRGVQMINSSSCFEKTNSEVFVVLGKNNGNRKINNCGLLSNNKS